jgi:hypothetical protein
VLAPLVGGAAEYFGPMREQLRRFGERVESGGEGERVWDYRGQEWVGMEKLARWRQRITLITGVEFDETSRDGLVAEQEEQQSYLDETEAFAGEEVVIPSQKSEGELDSLREKVEKGNLL